MSTPLMPWLRRLQRQQIVIMLAWLLPAWLVVTMVCGRYLPAGAAMASGLLAALVAAILCWRALRRMDLHWLVRRLDAGQAVLQDSSGLLLVDPPQLAPLQRLQRQRVADRLQALDADAGRLAIPRRRILLSWAVAAVVGLFLWLQPAPPRLHDADQSAADLATSAAAQTTGSILVTPPAYTGRPARRVAGLDAQVEQDATLHWTLRLDEPAQSVALHFHDGMKVPLQGHDRDWDGTAVRDQAGLYRVARDGVVDAQQPRQRIDVLVDQAPDIEMLQPAETLTLMAPDQLSQQIDFRVSDDYGIAAASILVTHAHGSGENVQFREQQIPLQPHDQTREGDRVVAHYSHLLAMDQLGVEAGDDVVVRISAIDNRRPQANISRSASHILRWPMQAAAAMDTLDGALQPVLPAYFRSQRQIIMDTEQLLADSETLDADGLLARSDSIGVDQRILRLRYGQFLGEETDIGDHGPGHGAQDDADGAVPPHGGAEALLEEYGHSHDDRDAATLFDPVTRETLRSALNAMWEAERHLRSGEPAAALPHEYEALENIKKVQEASRIYLARSGLETTPLDPQRRLTGERDDLQPRRQQLAALDGDNAVISAAWTALAINQLPDWPALEHWLREARADDDTDDSTLAILQAMDTLRADPQCAVCRQQLLAALWPRLPLPPAGLKPRRPPPQADIWRRAVEAGQP